MTYYLQDSPVLEEEPCCAKPDVIISREGTRVCRTCGMTFGVEMVQMPRRAFTAAEIRSRRQAEKPWRPFGPRTQISCNKRDAHGNHLTPNKTLLYGRLARVQRSLINGIERNYWEARPRLRTLSHHLGIPPYVEETAWRIYSQAPIMKLTLGRSIKDFVAAALYAAIRVHGFPRVMDDIVDKCQRNVRDIRRALVLLIRNVLPKLGFQYRSVNAEELIFRFGSELNLSMKLQRRAVNYFGRAHRAGFQIDGKDPKGLAAAALYLAARDTEEHLTQVRVASTARVTEVTLRSHAKEMRRLLSWRKN
ncbi:MAG: transcription initiation factor IIB [Promethearchaeota archaeon]